MNSIKYDLKENGISGEEAQEQAVWRRLIRSSDHTHTTGTYDADDDDDS